MISKVCTSFGLVMTAIDQAIWQDLKIYNDVESGYRYVLSGRAYRSEDSDYALMLSRVADHHEPKRIPLPPT